MSDLVLLTNYFRIDVKQWKSSNHPLPECVCTEASRAGWQSQPPMEERLKMSKESTMPKVDVTCYQSIISKLHYLTHTQPDLRFADCWGQRESFMEDPW